MAAGQPRGAASFLVEDGGVAQQDLVRPAAVADPQLVGPLRVPGGGGGRAVDLEHERVLASGADLGDGQRAAGPVLVAKQDRRGVLGRDLALHGLRAALRGECLDRSRRLAPSSDECRQVGHHRDDPLAGQEGREVHPVRADVGHGAQLAAQLGLEPPVPVRVEQQPVLEVVAGDEPDVAEPALAGPCRARAGTTG